MRDGITDQSLREMAAAIGTSHRMLLYHFKSREGLLIAVCNAVNEAVAGALVGGNVAHSLDRPMGTVDAPAAAPAMVTSVTNIVGHGVPHVAFR